MSDRPQFQPSTKPSPGTITRGEFDALAAYDKIRCVREGWKIIDGPSEPKTVVITRAAFESMPQAGRDLYLSRGGRVSDDLS